MGMEEERRISAWILSWAGCGAVLGHAPPAHCTWHGLEWKNAVQLQQPVPDSVGVFLYVNSLSVCHKKCFMFSEAPPRKPLVEFRELLKELAAAFALLGGGCREVRGDQHPWHLPMWNKCSDLCATFLGVGTGDIHTKVLKLWTMVISVTMHLVNDKRWKILSPSVWIYQIFVKQDFREKVDSPLLKIKSMAECVLKFRDIFD